MEPPRTTNRIEREDSSIIGTNDEATVSKLAAIEKGYYSDPYVKYFVKRRARRSVLINRGYFTRVAAIHKLLHQFLNSNSEKPKQIVNLGAGFDTTYFNLQSNKTCEFVFFEIDFPEVITNKIKVIKANPELINLIKEDLTENSESLASKSYNLIPADMRNFDNLKKALESSKLDTKAPTLFLSECVLIYMKSQDSAKIIKWAGENLDSASFVAYEQILPADAFGNIMIKNLKERGINLHGLTAYPDLPSQKQRFLSLGWENSEALDMNEVCEKWIGKDEISRVNKLEMLDEVEEWKLLQGHYCIVWATNDKLKTGMWNGFGY